MNIYKTIMYGLIYLLIGCTSNKKNEFKPILKYKTEKEYSQDKDTSLLFKDDKLKKFALTYESESIDVSKDINDTLELFLDGNIHADYIIDSLYEISKIILLKSYLYHLKRANQGYDLYTMRKGKAKYLIDIYLNRNNIDTIGEFLNSGIVWKLEKEKKNNTCVNLILKELNNEQDRIMLFNESGNRNSDNP